jgi:demethylmenaquinone methyltransferase/2-methoxy-6-polyprenyl-1,4-benzoquinol methylase
MATILRTWSYQYPWLYDGISKIAALAVGGEAQFRRLPLLDLPVPDTAKVLDLCCGCGQSTAYLVKTYDTVTGLDASPRSLEAARRRVPQAQYVQGFAEEMPLNSAEFDVVYTSVALHEMSSESLAQILQEVHRVLKPGGFFVFVDLHRPTNPLFWPGLAAFLGLFETETAWAFIQMDLPSLLQSYGTWRIHQYRLYAGGSLQLLQAQKQT